MGLLLDYYWSLNPKQWAKHLKIFNKKKEERIQEKDALNFLLGKYIAFAVNEPKKYPDDPFLSTTQKFSEMTDDEMERRAIRNTIKMGGIVK